METVISDAIRQGRKWALGLKAGDLFLGTMGEAKARGLTGDSAKAFHVAAYVNLPSYIACAGDSNRIAKVTK